MVICQPKVSIIIPTYNYAEFIGQCLTSVLQQEYQEIEIIVVDDGSTDNTREIVYSFKDKRIIYIYQQNQGAPTARNRGFYKSTGDFVMFLDSDDFLYFPYAIRKFVSEFERNKEIEAVYSDCYFCDAQGVIERKRSSMFDMSPTELTIKIRRESIFTVSHIIFRRECLEAIGLFKDLPLKQDWELHYRLITSNRKIDFINKPLVAHRRHPGGFWRGGDHLEIIRKLKKVLKILKREDRQNLVKRDKKKFVVIYYYLAREYFLIKDYRKAVACINQCTKLDNRYGEPFFLKGRIYTAKRELKRAMGEFSKAKRRQALRVDFIPDVIFNIALVYLIEGDLDKLDKIKDTLKEALGYPIKDRLLLGYSYYHLGLVYKEKGEYEKALKEFGRAEKKFKDAFNYSKSDDGLVADLHFHLGSIYREKGRTEQALKEFGQVLSLGLIECDLLDRTYYQLGMLYKLKDQIPQSLKNFLLVKKDINSLVRARAIVSAYDIISNFGKNKIYLRQDNSDTFLEGLDRKSLSSYYYHTAIELVEKGDQYLSVIIEYLLKAVDYDKNNYSALYVLGSSYKRLKAHDLARKRYQDVLGLAKFMNKIHKPKYIGSSCFHLANIEELEGSYDKSICYYARCLRWIPEHGQAKKNLDQLKDKLTCNKDSNCSH
ncbi:MAG: glycosyltransferase [bacterium]